MSINLDDFVGSLLDHQARVNFATDEVGQYDVIEDLYPLSTEAIGATEVANTSTTTPPHLWDDGQSAYGFCSWA